MRNPNRIYPICMQIAQEWYSNAADWRFMQTICNFMSYKGSDCFYMEDEVFISEFKKFLNQMKGTSTP